MDVKIHVTVMGPVSLREPEARSPEGQGGQSCENEVRRRRNGGVTHVSRIYRGIISPGGSGERFYPEEPSER